jgi:hypothetical protein
VAAEDSGVNNGFKFLPVESKRGFCRLLECGFDRKPVSILFEQSDDEQENHRADDGVDDCRDDATDDDKTNQW